MTSHATLCRAQEALQRRIAAESSLPNVRKVALAAALAWEKQAREAEGLGPEASGLSAEDAAIALEFLLEDQDAVPDTDEGQ